MRPLGLIVAGGRARRFGAEKAMAQVDGLPMIACVAAVLQPACAALAVNATANSGAAAWARGNGLPVLADPAGAPQGPLAGVLAGLDWAAEGGAPLLATAPCDTPWLPADLVPRLAGALTAEAGCAIAACGEDLHPLCAVWRLDRAPAVRAALEKGRHPPLHRLARSLGATIVRFEDPAAFANVNTPDDIEG